MTKLVGCKNPWKLCIRTLKLQDFRCAVAWDVGSLHERDLATLSAELKWALSATLISTEH